VRPARLVVYSDYLCPWCYVGTIRLHRLEDEFGGDLGLEWRSFLLRPRPDPNRTFEKFVAYTQSWLRPAAEEESAGFRVWSTQEGPPSHSVPPHLAAKAAATLGGDAFERLHPRLLRAYFVDNHDITALETLRGLWRDAGLPENEFDRIDDPALFKTVVDQHNEAIELGVGGVPSVRSADSDAVITGAHPYETYRRWVAKLIAT